MGKITQNCAYFITFYLRVFSDEKPNTKSGFDEPILWYSMAYRCGTFWRFVPKIRILRSILHLNDVVHDSIDLWFSSNQRASTVIRTN